LASALKEYRITSLPDGPGIVFAQDPVREIRGMGGTMGMMARIGIAMSFVVVCPTGEEWDGTTVRLVRKACAVLGVHDVRFLGAARWPADFLTQLDRMMEDMGPRTVFAPYLFSSGLSEGSPGLTAVLYEHLRASGYAGTVFAAAESGASGVRCLVDIGSIQGKKEAALRIFGKVLPVPVSESDHLLQIPWAPTHVEGYCLMPAASVRPGQNGGRFAHWEKWDGVWVVVSPQDACQRLTGALQHAAGLAAQAAAYRNDLSRITRSLSWRLTKPLREVKRLSRGQPGLNDGRLLKGWSLVRKEGFRGALLEIRQFRERRGGLRRYCGQESGPRWSLEDLSCRPLISVAVPVFDPPPRYLRACLRSVVEQDYPHWELCIADDASTDPRVRKIILDYARRFPDRVKTVFRDRNGHICEATNSALNLATGEFAAFLDHDDLLTRDALMEVAGLLNQHPDADMIYSDEDKVDERGAFSEPYFKPDWAPDMFMGQMYTCHLAVYRRSLLERLGGLRKGYEGAQDYDLVLRLSEITDRIYHIPRILYHWRKSPRSTAQTPSSKTYAFEAGLRSLNNALARRGEEARAEPADGFPGCYLVRYAPRSVPLVSVVILTRDQCSLLDRCLFSLFTMNDAADYEIVLMDNGSREEETFQVFDKWRRALGSRMRIERLDIPFNYPRLNNRGANLARGDLLLLLNNDTEFITPSPLKEMAGYAAREEIGAVGATLLYPDMTIQHAGVVLGITGTPGTPGVAGHSHKHFAAESEGYFGRLKIVSNYAAVTGACLMVNRGLYREAGGLDESLSVAFNDVDFCLRLLGRGRRNVVLPHVRLIHHESRSRGYEDDPKKQARFSGEIQTMLQRWGTRLETDPYYNPNLTLWEENFGVKSEKERRWYVKA
jgi:O-antigen biosynthesis protein